MLVSTTGAVAVRRNRAVGGPFPQQMEIGPMRLALAAALVGALCLPAAAAPSTQSGFHTGARAGRQVGGSVGTFVGGVTGAVVGTAGGIVHAVAAPFRPHRSARHDRHHRRH